MTIKNYAGGIITIAAALSLGACAKNTPPPAEPTPAAEAAPEAAAGEPAPLAEPTGDTQQYYVEGVAGGVMISKVQLEAEVVSVNQEKREAVLRGPEGKEVSVKVGKDAVNFYQVAAGDRVNVTVARELQIYVPKEGEEATPDGTEVMGASAAKGDAPAGVVVASTQVTSTVTAMDLKARTATLKFEDGRSETFDVRPDVDMTKYKVGQKVVFLITDMLALEVKKI